MSSPETWRNTHTASHAVLYAAGEDLHRVLWLKSRSSEVWLERRTHYTRSCAVMSMVRFRPLVSLDCTILYSVRPLQFSADCI